MLLVGGGLHLLHYTGGRPPRTNERTPMRAPLDPEDWRHPSGDPVDRTKLMVALNRLEGLYLRASYGTDPGARAK